MPLPRSIEHAPVLNLGLELYYQAFWDLNTCRTIGMSFGPIPWSAVAEYSRFNYFDTDQYEELWYFIQIMDKTYLDHVSKKHARVRDTKPPISKAKK